MSNATKTQPKDLCGWGRTARSSASVVIADDVRAIEDVLHGPGHAIARGLGRSYGDAAQCGGGTVVESAGLSAIGDVSVDGTVTVGAGVTIHRLLRAIVPQGWFVPVTPGTRYVSIGGAIAADIHGKNHHLDGSFCAHVLEMTLVTPTGTHPLSPDTEPELFWATAGGMGLTGVVVSATLQLIPIETTWMKVDTLRFTDLDSLMSTMATTDGAYGYSVAWLDCLRGRTRPGVLTRADHVPAGDLPPRLRSRSLVIPERARVRVPVAAPRRAVTRTTVRALNEAWFRTSVPASRALKPMAGFFHPLDGIDRWNLLYGPDGFVQYQFAVAPERGDVVTRAVDAIADSGVPSFLAVLKRFGPGTPGPLSFAQKGWTLALDFPLGPERLPTLLDHLDDLVAEAGGRIYLAKDARLRPELMSEMYPRTSELALVRKRVDPEGVLCSDLSCRLGLN